MRTGLKAASIELCSLAQCMVWWSVFGTKIMLVDACMRVHVRSSVGFVCLIRAKLVGWGSWVYARRCKMLPGRDAVKLLQAK